MWHNTTSIQESKGYLVEHDGVEIFVHRALPNHRNGWLLSERSTGLYTTFSVDTLKEVPQALQKLSQKVANAGTTLKELVASQQERWALENETYYIAK